MSHDPIVQHLLAIDGIAHDGIHAAIVGDSHHFATTQKHAPSHVELVRKPPKAAALKGSEYAFTVPGYYQFQITAGGFKRDVQIVCFPASVLTLKVDARPDGNLVSRVHLTALTRDPRVTADTVAAALEVDNPHIALEGILGGTTPVNFAHFGN